jgi:hypothetical protein
MFKNVSILVHVSSATNGSALVHTTFPVPGSFGQYDDNSSTTRDIAFGIIATILAIVGVAIAYLQYHHTRSTAIEASGMSTDFELGSRESSNERDITEDPEVFHVHSGHVEKTYRANACLDAINFTIVDVAMSQLSASRTLRMSMALYVHLPEMMIVIYSILQTAGLKFCVMWN